MKKTFIIITLLMFHASFAKQLMDYQQISNELQNGNKIVVVTDFNKCETPMPVSGQFIPSDNTVHHQFM